MLLANADPSGQGALGLRLTQCYSNFAVYKKIKIIQRLANGLLGATSRVSDSRT